MTLYTWVRNVLGVWMSKDFSLMMLTFPRLFDTSKSTSMICRFNIGTRQSELSHYELQHYNLLNCISSLKLLKCNTKTASA